MHRVQAIYRLRALSELDAIDPSTWQNPRTSGGADADEVLDIATELEQASDISLDTLMFERQ